MTGFPKRVRDVIRERSEGVCEVCGQTPAVQQHHRRPRAAGGTSRPESNQPSNGLDVCVRCHHQIESHRTDALTMGWLVRQTDSPTLRRVLRRGEWVWLDDHGGVLTVEDLMREGEVPPWQ